MRNDREKLIQVLSGWTPYGLLWDPARGLVVTGSTKVLLLDDGVFQDVSPWRETITGPMSLAVRDLCLDSAGHWLGLSTTIDAVVRYDGENWTDTELTLSDLGSLSSALLSIQPTVSGDYLIYSPTQVGRLVPGSEAP